MKNIFLVGWVIVSILVGCSRFENPMSVSSDTEPSKSFEIFPLYVTDYSKDGRVSAGMGVLGLFEMSINLSGLTAEIVSLRKSSSADVLEVVDITNFMQIAPCTNCVKIRSVGRDSDGHLVLSIGIKHPFGVGDPLKPITGRNRADLHVFNVEGIVISNSATVNFAHIGQKISGLKLVNADGYTGYLDSALDKILPTEATVHPYILHFDDYTAGNYSASNPMGFASVVVPPPSGNLVMAMGCDYNYQDYVFDLGTEIPKVHQFIYAVGCTYGVSADTKSQRFNPVYRVPQYNKKAASEVRVEVAENKLVAGDIASKARIQVKVVDINHGVEVGDELNQMRADSSVSSISVEIVGVTSGAVNISSAPLSGSGHSPADPLIFEGTVTNMNAAPEGNYVGLVKVLDSYPPALNVSPLLGGKDGIERVGIYDNPLLGLFNISEFATYQIFNISVAAQAIPPIVTSISPNQANLNDFVDNAVISGSYFVNVISVRLEKGSEVIEADSFNVDSSSQITADFDLAGFTTGLYDVVVELNGGFKGSLDDGFEITYYCETGIHHNLQYEGTYQLNWNQAPIPSWHRTYDIASLPDGRILMQGFSGGVPCLMAFDVTQNGLVNGQVIVSNQWGTSVPNLIMSMDVCDVTGNIVLVLSSNSGKMIVFSSTGGIVASFSSRHDVFTAVDTDWDGGIWTVEYILNSDPTPLGKNAFIEHYERVGMSYVHNPAHTVEITNDLELNPCKVTEIGIVFTAQRLILLEHSSYPWKGNMYNYDLSNGAPILIPSLTQRNFLSTPLSESQIGHWRKAFDIEIDHSDKDFEQCRIILARRSGLGWTDGSYITKYDIDMNKLAEYHIEGTPTQDHLLETFTLCPNPNNPDGIFLTIHEGWLSDPEMDAFEVYAMPDEW